MNEVERLRAELEQVKQERDAWRELHRYWRRMAHRFADPETIVKALEADAGLEVENDTRA